MVIGDIRLEYKTGGKSGTYIGDRNRTSQTRSHESLRSLQSCNLHCHEHRDRRLQPGRGLDAAAAVRRSAAPRVSAAHVRRRLGSRRAAAGLARRRRGVCRVRRSRPRAVARQAALGAGPAAGVGHMLSAELIASPIVLTSARGVRARAIAEHVIGMTHRARAPAAARCSAARPRTMGARRDRSRRRRSGRCAGAGWRIVGLGSIGARGRATRRARSACGFRPSASTLDPADCPAMSV